MNEELHHQQLHEYRVFLIEAEKKAQEDFDKAILSLSGGALGISFAFVTDLVTSNSPTLTILLILSWLMWTLSLMLIATSFFFSQKAYRKAINQVDSKTIYTELAGSKFTKTVEWLNILSGVSFFCGNIFMFVFVFYNL